jgi:N-acetylglucosamine-6-phosphate deacetylase
MTVQAIAATRLFTGEEMLADHAVLIEAGRVHDIVPSASVPFAEHLPEALILCPGFIDVQVNGGGGALFNDSPDLPTLRRIAAAHRRFGTTALLPTLITDTPEMMRKAVAVVADAMARGEPGIAGLHLEGPFISAARRGVHRADFVRAITAGDIDFLCAETPRPLQLTLAPECVSGDHVRQLAAAGVTVSIGHTDATFEQATDTLAKGARGFTHLFNAMPPLAGRAPGPVGAALDSNAAYAGLIVDGHHVHPASLRTALRALTARRAMLISDAMPSIGTDMTSFMLQDRRILVAEGRLTTEDGTLAGAHLDMASAVRNAVALLGTTLADALRMATATPADFLGIGHERGRLLPGSIADLISVTDSLSIEGIWMAGTPALAGPNAPC